VEEYDIATRTKTSVPQQPGNSENYFPSVSSTGTVYFASSGSACGANVTLVKYPLGGPATVLIVFPRGIDLSSTYVDDTSGTPTVYYSKSACNKDGSRTHGDVYKVVD
jgi:hypothetical protein